MKKTYFVSLILFFALFAGGVITSGSELAYFFDPLSLGMVLVIPALFALATNSLDEIQSYFSAAFQEKPDSGVVKKGIVFFKNLLKYFIFTGFITFMIGVITILAYLGELQHVGSGAALSLISLLYSLCFILILALPFKSALEKKAAALEK